jgi:hypothetical protein
LAILLTNLPSVAHSQSLGTIQREATTPTSRQKSNDRRDDHHHHHDDHDDGDSFLGSLLGVFLQGMFDSTTASSDTSIDFQYDDHVESTPSTNYFFAHYPYADGLGGYMFDEHLDVRPENRGQSIWFEYGNDFDQIQRYSMKFLLEDRSGWSGVSLTRKLEAGIRTSCTSVTSTSCFHSSKAKVSPPTGVAA